MMRSNLKRKRIRKGDRNLKSKLVKKNKKRKEKRVKKQRREKKWKGKFKFPMQPLRQKQRTKYMRSSSIFRHWMTLQN